MMNPGPTRLRHLPPARRRRAVGVVVLGVAVALPGLVACTPDPAPSPTATDAPVTTAEPTTPAEPAGDVVTISYDSEQVTIGVGDTLVVDFGEINPSIGDGWELTTPPDESVLRQVEGVVTERVPGNDGGDVDLGYGFAAVASGTTTLGFSYAYRGAIGDPEDRADPDTSTITVTVED